MIRKYTSKDLNEIMEIWLESNIQAHNFIHRNYWMSNFEYVKNILPKAEIFVYEDDITHKIHGFIGLNHNFIEGLFVKRDSRLKHIGRNLLNAAKETHSCLSLKVYLKNINAINFYIHENFVICSETTDSNTNEKEYIMTWRIPHK